MTRLTVTDILEDPLLRHLFDAFCRRNLLGESIGFLLETNSYYQMYFQIRHHVEKLDEIMSVATEEACPEKVVKTPRTKSDDIRKNRRSVSIIAQNYIEVLEKKADYIIDTYIRVNSTEELNIDEYVREEVLRLLEAKSYADLFKRCRAVITFQLQEDVIPRFIRCPLWFEYLKNPRMKIPKQTKAIQVPEHLLISPTELQEEGVTEKLVQIGLSLYDDNSDWKLVYGSNTNCTFVSPTQYLKQNEDGTSPKLLLSKSWSYYNHNLSDVLRTMGHGSYYSKVDPTFSSVTTLKISEPDRYNLPYWYVNSFMSTNIAPILTKRFLVSSGACLYFAKKKMVLLISKSYNEPDETKLFPNGKGKKHIKAINLSFQFFQEITPTKTKCTLITLVNLGGWLSHMNVFAACKKMVSIAINQKKTTEALIQQNIRENFKNTTDNVGINSIVFLLQKHMEMMGIERDEWPQGLDYENANMFINNWIGQHKK